MRATDSGYAPRFLSMFLALGFFSFRWRVHPPTAANARRWAAKVGFWRFCVYFALGVLGLWLIAVLLLSAHKWLDAAVFAAYGWTGDLSDEEILEKLLALNLERAKQV